MNRNGPIRRFGPASVLLALLTIGINSQGQEFDTQALLGVTRSVQVDVVADGTSFFFEGGTTETGFPADGTPFVVEGYLYPAGTLEKFGAASGVLKNGDPAFPDLVLGTWSCRGWHIQRGDATSGPAVVTTQLFRFGTEDGPGAMLVTDGIELADFDKPFSRPITGGSGIFRMSRGQMMQTNVAVNVTGGFNLTLDIEVAN